MGGGITVLENHVFKKLCLVIIGRPFTKCSVNNIVEIVTLSKHQLQYKL